MATSGASLPHRAISTIRGDGQISPTQPRTPRNVPNLSSSFNSPSTLRAEEDVIVIEFGSRKLHVGYAGDSVPKARVEFGPEQQRRVGDLRLWEPGYTDNWRKRAGGEDWGKNHELWQFDIRGEDMGLVGDRLERGLREAFTKYLLIDSRPRKMAIVLPVGMPIPLIATTLETLFGRFHAPIISLYSSPVATTMAAGVRSALIIDLGWAETVVTGVYEYREVQCYRSVRGGKLLVENTHSLLAAALGGSRGTVRSDEGGYKEVEHKISFEECEDITSRMIWCKPARATPTPTETEGLATVTEQDESEANASSAASGSTNATIPLKSSSPPTKVNLTHDQLSAPCESTFFDSQHPLSYFDDEELPLPFLVYQSLLKLPFDVRAICMSRIIFTGGCSRVLGLRGRIFDEVGLLVQERGWDPVQGKSVEAYKNNPKLNRKGKSASVINGTTVVSQQDGGGGGGGGSEQDGVWHDAANANPEVDPIDEKLQKAMDKPEMHGQLRAIESLGAWSGASMLSQLKVAAVATVERDAWQAHGVNGATRPSEVDLKAQQRQSMGAGGLIRGNPGANWTLGVWGAI